jgi:hypothetical protein
VSLVESGAKTRPPLHHPSCALCVSLRPGFGEHNEEYSALSRFLVPQPSLILGSLQQFLFPQFHLEHIKFMPEAESLQVTCRFGLQAGVVGALSLVPGSLDCLLVHSICSLPGGLEIAEPPPSLLPPDPPVVYFRSSG